MARPCRTSSPCVSGMPWRRRCSGASRGPLRKSPLQVHVADLGATVSGDLAVAGLLRGDQPGVRQEIADAGETVDGVDLVQQHQAKGSCRCRGSFAASGKPGDRAAWPAAQGSSPVASGAGRSGRPSQVGLDAQSHTRLLKTIQHVAIAGVLQHLFERVVVVLLVDSCTCAKSSLRRRTRNIRRRTRSRVARISRG
jgi:hypothetical protein